MRTYLVRPRPPSRLTWERRSPAVVRRDDGYYWVIRGGDPCRELASDGPMTRRQAKEAIAQIIREESDDHLLEGEVVEYQILADQDIQCHKLYVVRGETPSRLSVFHEILSSSSSPPNQSGRRRQYRLIRKCRTAVSALTTIENRLNRDRIAGSATGVCWILPI